MLPAAPWLMIALLTLPVLAGLGAIVVPAFGYLPALQHDVPGLMVWRELLTTPGIGRSAGLSLSAALLTPLLSLILVMLFLASTSGTPWASAMRRLVAPLLAVTLPTEPLPARVPPVLTVTAPLELREPATLNVPPLIVVVPE